MGLFDVLSGSKRKLNIVFTDHSIRFLELKQQDPIIVQSFQERMLPAGMIHDGKIVDHGALEMILEECVEEWGYKKREVRFIVPDQFVIIRNVLVPGDLKTDEIKGYLFLELGTSIHLPFEDPVFDFSLIGEKDGKLEVLLIACPEDIVDDYRALLEDVTLKPTVADISSLSLYRLYVLDQKIKKDEHIMLVNYTKSLMTISIFHQHQPIFTRPISLELEDSVETGSAGELEDSFKEIEKVMSFYRYSVNKGEHQVQRILLSGDHPQLQEILPELKSRLKVDVEQRVPKLESVTAGEPLPSKYMTALGLALKEVQ